MKSSVSVEGVYAKVERAQKQLRWLEADIVEFCESQQQLIVHKVDRAAGRQAWVFRGETPRPPVDFSVRVGEFVHNLRSGLDHLVWQLVIANGQTPSNGNEFPIFRESAEYKRAIERRLKGVDQGAMARIESMQPFQKHGGTGSQLWTLRCLSNIDKHRHINMVVLYSEGAIAEIIDKPGQPHSSPMMGYENTGRLEKNKELAVFNDPDSVMDMEFLLSVGFGGTVSYRTFIDTRTIDTIEAEFDFIAEHGPAGSPVVDTLRKCLSDVIAVCANFGLDVPTTDL